MGFYVGQLRAAEFFAGIGLVRAALEQAGFHIVFSNDIDKTKRIIYEANFGSSDFVLSDIRDLTGDEVPDIELAAASFPCTDVSLAGARAGFKGKESSLVREFLRILGEMGPRKPLVVLLENVTGFATSNKGEDLSTTVSGLNGLGYTCDIVVIDARNFVPQSRPRVFVVGSLAPPVKRSLFFVSEVRPSWVVQFAVRHPELSLNAFPLPQLPVCHDTLADTVQRFDPNDPIWWDEARLGAFLSTLSPIQAQRLEKLRLSPITSWATAYRRTRYGKPMWEIRSDGISGCLRTGRGGSSRQALVEAGEKIVRVRWMTSREYASLQGAPDFDFAETTENQARFALGDAVCVPAVAWLAMNCLFPIVTGYSRVDDSLGVAVGGNDLR